MLLIPDLPRRRGVSAARCGSRPRGATLRAMATPDAAPDSSPPPEVGERRTIPGAVAPLYNLRESQALSTFAVVAVATIAWIAHPVAVGLFLGMLGAFTLQPLHVALRRRVKGRFDGSALACTLLAGVAVVGLASLFFTLLISRGTAVASALPAWLARGGGLEALARPLAPTLARLHVRLGDLGTRLGESAGTVAARATGIAATVAGATFDWLLGLLFALVTLHFTLVHWSSLTARLENMLPLHPRHTHALLDEFRHVGRTVLAGTVITGLVQGVLAWVGYALTGVPEAALLGALTAVASLVPAVGTLLVWVPAGVYLMLTHHAGRGVAELVWGALMVGVLSDYVIRPRLVGGGGEMPTLLTFVALFGGVEAFGIIGLILGPVLMALALAVLRIYERESVHRRARIAAP